MSVLIYGVTVAVIGILTVFFGLTLLIISITVMGKIFKAINDNKAAKEAAKAAAQAPAAPVEAAPVEEAVEEGISPEVIAVIAAAIAAFDNSNKQLVVRKVRKVGGWNRTARQEQVVRF